MRAYKKIMLGLLTCLLASCSPSSNYSLEDSLENKEKFITYSDENISIKLKEIQEFDIHTDIQNQYLSHYYTHYDDYACGDKELSKANNLKISWEVSSIYSNLKYEFIIDNNEDYTNAKTYQISTPEITLYNLLINTTYYYKIKAYNGENCLANISSSFDVITNKLRNLSFDNVTNARDIGGYKTSKDKEVKQGKIIRCSRLNSNSVNYYEASVSALDINLFKNLNIKSEVDLREDNKERHYQEFSPLLNTSYYKFPMTYSGNVLLMNVDILPELFEFLANENNYPMIIHCNIGTDRTGMVCFLIEAILGMKIEDIYRDYLFSNFANIGSSRSMSAIDSYLNKIGSYGDNDLQEKTNDYLINLGVKQEDIDSLKEIMLI